MKIHGHGWKGSEADLQISSNYPQNVLNTGLFLVRSNERTIALMQDWLKLIVAHKCKDWACNDQEILTHLIEHCGWRRPQSEEHRLMRQWGNLQDNDQQEISCAGQHGLKVDLLPPRFFPTGHGACIGLLRMAELHGQVFTYHPNFSGWKQGAKKSKLEKMHIKGRSMWCLGK